jgi:hypothetical protein
MTAKLKLAIAAWLLAVVAGNAWLLLYSLEPGRSAGTLARWPETSSLKRTDGVATLIMFAHPKCPCTQASVSELARLLNRLPAPPRTYVVFLQPQGVESGWEHTTLWERAAAIPGVTVVADHDSVEADQFAAKTSGTTMLFDATGVLRFSGGLTAARGHEGASIGQERIVSLLTGGTSDRPSSDVYGCALSPSSAIASIPTVQP